MFEPHGLLRTPADDVKIWRYMDLAKFISLLDNAALYFPSVYSLFDPFEGYSDAAFVHSAKFDDAMIASARTPDERQYWELLAKNRSEARRREQINGKTTVFVSCWHMNPYESAAMWDVYVRGNYGVAIQSTIGSLKHSMRNHKSTVYIGEIDYVEESVPQRVEVIDQRLPVNKDSPPIASVGGTELRAVQIIASNGLVPFFRKRPSFKHENEVRAAIWDSTIEYERAEFDPKAARPGITVKVEPNELIEKVYVAPTIPRYVTSAVESVAKKFGLNKEVKQSTLYDLPA